MLNLKTKALYISLFVILILIILNQNSFVFSQSKLPVCVSPGSLIVWPGMTPNTVPMASTSNGILRNSYIKFGTTSAYNAYHSIFDTLYIYSQLYSNDNVITNPDENRANWVIVNRGPLYTTGPRNNYNSGGAIGFRDYSTDTTKLYYTTFVIDQSPYKFYDNNGNVGTSSSYGILRFHYGEFNPTNATITSPRLGEIPPGRNRWRGGLLSLTWEGNLGIGTTSPQDKLHVSQGGIILEGGVNVLKIIRPRATGTEGYARGVWFYNPTGTQIEAGIGFRGDGNNPPKRIYLTHGNNGWDSTRGIHILDDGNVGIGTITPNAKLHVVGNVRADQFCLGNNCITNWPSGGINYWILSGNSLYATPTNVNVGIGTITPSAKLHVVGDTIVSGNINANNINASTTTASRFCLGNSCITNWPSGGTNYWILSGNSLYATPTTINKLGLGTTSPQANIHINSNDNWISFRIDRNNSSRWTFGNSSDNSFYIDSQQGGGRVLTLTPLGNVGIGTNSPGAKLHVMGSTIIQGSQKVYSSDGSRLLFEITEE
jgi:hypothetical protein